MGILSGAGAGGGGKVGTGFVKIKPDAEGFGAELDQQVGKQGNRAGGAMGAAMSTAAKGAFAAGVAGMATGVFKASGFDAGMREVFTLMPQLSAEARNQMSGDVKAFASEFGVLPDEVIPSLYNSISAGVPPDNVFEFLEQSQKLAKGGATDLATAVDGLSSVVNAYGPDALSAAEASDALFTAVKLGKTTVDEMSSSLFQVAPIAAAMGVGFDEVSASIATLTAQGTPTSVAATQMKGAISELGKEGSKAWKSFEEATGKTFPQFLAEGGTLTEGFGLMQVAAEANGSSIQNMFGSIEAGQAALGIVKDIDKSTANLDAVADSAGATDVAFAEMNQGLAATMDKLKAKFAVTLIDLGEALAPTVETVGLALAGLIDMFTALPAPMRTGIVLFGTLAAGALAFAGPMLKLVKVAKLLGDAMSLLAANPWVLAIVGLVAVTVLIVKHWDKVQATLSAVWEWIRDAGGAIARWFVDLWEGAIGAVVTAWHGMTDGITGALSAVGGAISTAWSAITDTIGAAIDGIGSVISSGLEAISTVITFYLNTYRTIFETAWNAVRTVVETVANLVTVAIERNVAFWTEVFARAWNTVTSTTSAAWDTVYGIVTGVGEAVVGFVTGIPNRITTAFAGLADLIAAPFRSAFEGIRSAWNSTVGGFSVGIPGVLGFGGVSFTIPSMATGALVASPMIAQIGDAGPGNPEIVSPVKLMRDTVSDALANAGGSGLTVETHLHVDGTTDIATFERMLDRASVEIVRVVQREVDRQRRAEGRSRGALVA